MLEGVQKTKANTTGDQNLGYGCVLPDQDLSKTHTTPTQAPCGHFVESGWPTTCRTNWGHCTDITGRSYRRSVIATPGKADLTSRVVISDSRNPKALPRVSFVFKDKKKKFSTLRPVYKLEYSKGLTFS